MLCVYSACFVDISVLGAPYPSLQVFVIYAGSDNGTVALASITIICISLGILKRPRRPRIHRSNRATDYRFFAR